MQIPWKKLEVIGVGALAALGYELPKLAHDYPTQQWVGLSSAVVVAVIAYLRMSPGGAAAWACASAQLAPATEVSNLDSTERACVSWADARAAADECIATTYAAFCKRYPDSCPQDGGAE